MDGVSAPMRIGDDHLKARILKILLVGYYELNPGNPKEPSVHRVRSDLGSPVQKHQRVKRLLADLEEVGLVRMRVTTGGTCCGLVGTEVGRVKEVLKVFRTLHPKDDRL